MCFNPKPVHWSTTFKFYNKEQQEKLVHSLLEQEINYDFEVYTDHEETYTVYYVHIEEMCLGNNLKCIAIDLENIMKENEE